MKNLVMIHLESLNYQLFMNCPELFKNLHKIKKEGLFFDHYFSTATSTLMVVGDIFYGGKEQFESCTSLSDKPTNYYYDESLFDELKKFGYNTGIFVHPDGGDRESAEKRHIAGFSNEMVLKQDYMEFLRAIEELIAKEPFAAMACNYISNVTINRFVDPNNIMDGTDKWRLGYMQLDEFVGDIIHLLENENQLEKTMIVLYGDHGDDFWGHGLHNGLVHAVEPYAQLIHLPMIVLDQNIHRGVEHRLICATDLRKWVMKHMNVSDCDYVVMRDYVVARSAYAAQPLRKESFNKSYSITDGKFLLLVSNLGIELYDIEMDYQCACNFLEFFMIDEGIVRFDEEYNGYLSYHFRDFMNDKQIARIRQTTYYLQSKLYDEILKLYLLVGKTELDLKQEMKFSQINYKYR